eukprot:m.201029 g.201029  ORF g.201029 m.201029 type:complete len:294 (+) comp18795_c0_seq39:299-1180(+)
MAQAAPIAESDGIPEFHVSVVLPAAGTGQRAATPTPKQYWTIESQPLLYYTIKAFELIPWVTEIIIPVAEVHVKELTAKALSPWCFNKCKFIKGDQTRHRSIRSGVAAVSEECTVVIIHDAVRPFVDEPTLRAVTQAAHTHGAAGTILPLVSTVIKVDKDGFLEESLDRNLYRGSQTPQAFRREHIQHAYAKVCCYSAPVFFVVVVVDIAHICSLFSPASVWVVTSFALCSLLLPLGSLPPSLIVSYVLKCTCGSAWNMSSVPIAYALNVNRTRTPWYYLDDRNDCVSQVSIT